MHTSQSSYTRIFFGDIDDIMGLEDLIDAWDLEETGTDNAFDLGMSEGSELMLSDALESIAFLSIQNSFDDVDLVKVMDRLVKEFKENGETPHSVLFKNWRQTDADPSDYDFSTTISPEEIFDIINAMSCGFKVLAVYSNWGYLSSKNVFNGCGGGNVIITKFFSAPCHYVNDENVKELVKLMDVKQTTAEIAAVYFDMFIKPMLESIVSKDLYTDVQDQLFRRSEQFFVER